MSGLSWATLSAAGAELPAAPPRKTLTVQPVLVYDVYVRQPQTSWRAWGGIQTQADADAERKRIDDELKKLRAEADFPLQFQPLVAVRSVGALAQRPEVKAADVLLVFAAGGDISALDSLKKDVIIFLRHQSGPLYLWYEIVSPRFLRRHTDNQVVPNIDPADVVVDRFDEVLWRLRALGGLANTRGCKILAVGGASAWAQPPGVVPDLVKRQWNMEILTLGYDELGKLIQAARRDPATVARAEQRTDAYLKIPGTKMEVERRPLVNAFLLENVFRNVMAQHGCRAMTINDCMSTIMPKSETTACMPLSTLNDDGYLAFCESDFVVIPSGVLLASIAGRPMFLNDPTYPHDGLITLAHCTAPRKLDGRNYDPVRILTHFESDYGASPKVEMQVGRKVTNIAPDFAGKRWVGFLGEIAASPFLPICRSQIEVKFACDSKRLAERMPGFHWMMVYGDYMRETGYALKRVPITWETLS